MDTANFADAPTPAVTTPEDILDLGAPTTGDHDVESTLEPDHSPLFGGMDDTAEPSIISEETTLEEEPSEEAPSLLNMGVSPLDTPAKVDSTDAFITASLAQLTDMMDAVASKKQAYLDEAQAHKEQKESFAQKEKEANEKASSMDGEIAHIKSMQRYFETQKDKLEKGSDLDESVNTALTGIAVQENVKGTMEKDTKKAPSRAKKVTA